MLNEDIRKLAESKHKSEIIWNKYFMRKRGKSLDVQINECKSESKVRFMKENI